MTPRQHRTAIKVSRSEILDSPFLKPTLKPEVRRRLDDIASETLAHIAVVNSPLSAVNRTPPDGISINSGWSGLETERVCELVITGTEDAVDLARVRLLVMLDELVSLGFFVVICSLRGVPQSGLHAEICEIDHKMHPIVAGKKRHVIQTIQEETATNIYFPSPLQGVFATDPTGTGTLGHSTNTIWITGEFFGVQRARDMLYQVSLNKVHNTFTRA